MNLGFVSAILPELSLDEVLAFAAAEGFATVELMSWPAGKAERKFAGVTHVDVTSFTQVQADDILALTHKHSVSISSLGYYPNLLDPDESVSGRCTDHLKKVIAAAPMLGLGGVNTFIGRDWTKSVDENWPRFLKIWKPLIAFAADHGVNVGIENCPMLFTRDEWPGGKNLATSPAIWRRMFSDIPAVNFGLNYDPSHMALQFMDPLAPLREFRDKLFHVHAKDVKIQRDRLNEVGVFAEPLQWHQPRIPGYGEIDWAQFMGALTETGYDGPVCIEVEDDTFGKTLAGRQRALKVARNVLRPYLRMTTLFASLDLGGTTLHGALADADGKVVCERTVPTESHAGPAAVISRMAELVNALAAEAGAKPAAVGLGVPGLVDVAQGITRFLPNFPTQWRGVPVRDELAPKIGCPVFLLNDARTATLGELVFGHGRTARTMIYFGLGTGVGGGVVIDGRLRLGPLGAAGELGHQTILPDGPLCGCGNRGCLETLVSGPAITAEGVRLLLSGNAPVLSDLCQGSAAAVSPATMRAAAEGGEVSITKALARAGEWLGIGAANLVTCLHPDLIVVGGGVSELGDLLLEPVRDTIRLRVGMFPPDDVRVVRSALGDRAGLLGGIALAASGGLVVAAPCQP